MATINISMHPGQCHWRQERDQSAHFRPRGLETITNELLDTAGSSLLSDPDQTLYTEARLYHGAI